MRGILGLSFTLILAMTFTSCNRKTTETENQLLVETWDTPFGVPPFDRISTGDFAPALEQGRCVRFMMAVWLRGLRPSSCG